MYSNSLQQHKILPRDSIVLPPPRLLGFPFLSNISSNPHNLAPAPNGLHFVSEGRAFLRWAQFGWKLI